MRKISFMSLVVFIILVSIISTIKTHDYINSYPSFNVNEDYFINEQKIINKVSNDTPLNVIILYPDDWRYNDIGGLSPIVRTPFLNYLASLGMHFTRNAVTTSICWISRASMFTGQYVSRHASTHLKRPYFATHNWNMTWPFQLQKHKEYFVGHVGKWQFYDDDDYLPRIFNFTRIHEGYHWYLMRVQDGKRAYISATKRARDDVFEFLDERPKDKPFALTVAFYPPKPVGNEMEPGAQWIPSKKMKKIYENETIPLPPNHLNQTNGKDSIPEFVRNDKNPAISRFKERWRTYEHYQEGMKNYYGLISQVDHICGEIFNRLQNDNLLNQTMIIFTTDNGLMHGAHSLAGKWYPYDESIRVPLIIYDPRIPANKRGTTDESLTLNIDLAETILGAAGIESPSAMQGRDISELYLYPRTKKEGKPWRTEFFYEYPGSGLPRDPRVSAVVSKDWKYIYWPENNVHQLFDMKNDPYELHDLAANITKKNVRRLYYMKHSHAIWQSKVAGSTELPVSVFNFAGFFYSNQIDERLINGVCSGWYGSRLFCVTAHIMFPFIKHQLLKNFRRITKFFMS